MGIDGVPHRPATAVAEAYERADSGSVGAHLFRFAASPGRHEHEVVPAGARRPKRQPSGARRNQLGPFGGIQVDRPDAGEVVNALLPDQRPRRRVDDRHVVGQGAQEFQVPIAVEVGDIECGGVDRARARHQRFRRRPCRTVETPSQHIAVGRRRVDLAVAVAVGVGGRDGGEG